MNEEKKEEIRHILHVALNQYWKENIINKIYLGKTIVENKSQRLNINNVEDLICSLCCPFNKKEDLPTIYGRGICFVKSPSGEGCISQNIAFSINNTNYDRIIEGDEIRIIITDIFLMFE